MRRRLTVLIFAAAMAVFAAFAGTASAQDDRPVEVWSLPTEVWSSPETDSPQRYTADTPEARTYQAASPSATELLRQPPFPPTDISLLSPGLYTDGPPTAPAAPGPNDEDTLRQQLNSGLVRRFGANSPRIAEGLAIFDAESTKQVVPHPRLRAALVFLLGTTGEPSINSVLDGTFAIVRFGELSNPFNAAESQLPEGGTKREIVFNEKYQYEDFRLLAPVMAHETFHSDNNISNKEELVADSIADLIYGQVLLSNPDVASLGTEFSRSLNTNLMGRLNSRDTNGNLRLLTSTGNIAPGSGTDFNRYADAFQPLGDDTPGNEVLRGELVGVVGPGVTVPANPDFDDATVSLLDLNQNALSDAEVVRLAEILKLDVYAPSITKFSPTGRTGSRTPTIKATVSDKETNLGAGNIDLFVDGDEKTAFNYSRAADRLTFRSGRLSFGKHTVEVIATDPQGKSTSATWSFTVARR